MDTSAHSKNSYTLALLSPADAESFRDIRLEGLRTSPEFFGASWEDEARQPLSWFAQRLHDNQVFGAQAHDMSLAGVAGLRIPTNAKLKHKGELWGMFIRPSARGQGVANALLQHLIEHARQNVQELLLHVEATNAPAVRLYSAAGFKEYGLERRAMKVEDRYYDALMMSLVLDTEFTTPVLTP